jgi:hypothetical protein
MIEDKLEAVNIALEKCHRAETDAEMFDPLCDLWDAAIEPYKIALADAIRRPMGVVPDSAQGLVSQDEVQAAEERRGGS